jgi:hypothetical protein
MKFDQHIISMTGATNSSQPLAFSHLYVLPLMLGLSSWL